MQQAYYDLHIHTALSPCADNDMVPGDIVGMAILNNLDVIAVTDHNSIANAKAVCDAAKAASKALGRSNELIVLPGIEVTTAEEVHVVCLFDSYDAAVHFDEKLSVYYNQLENRTDIFGEQIIIDENDKETGIMERMLIAPTTVTFDSLHSLTKEFGGAFVPAHVDRGSFSVMSNLGFLPPELDIATVEFTSQIVFGEAAVHDFSNFPGKRYVFSSDAHQLHAINERIHYVELPEMSARAMIDCLRGH